MRKKIADDYATKAKRREMKKRPRMKIHGAGLKKSLPHAGKKITAR